MRPIGSCFGSGSYCRLAAPRRDRKSRLWKHLCARYSRSRRSRDATRKLAQLRCCTTNKTGNVNGDPLNIVVVGRGIDALFAFIERGWRLDEPFDFHSTYRTIRAFLFGSEHFNAPVSPRHVFGATGCRIGEGARPTVNGIIFGVGGPFTIDELQVWVGESAVTTVLSRTQSRHWENPVHLPGSGSGSLRSMQDSNPSGAVLRFGFVRGVGVSSMPNHG